MTVAKLIEKLREYTQDTRVVATGSEGGVYDVNEVLGTAIYLNCNAGTLYYGVTRKSLRQIRVLLKNTKSLCCSSDLK